MSMAKLGEALIEAGRKAKESLALGGKTKRLEEALEHVKSGEGEVAEKIRRLPREEAPAPASDVKPEVVPRETLPAKTDDAATDLELEQVVRATEQKRIGEAETNINFDKINSEEDILTLADEVTRQSKARGTELPRTTLEEISFRASGKTIDSLKDIIGDRAYAKAEKILQPDQLVAMRNLYVTLGDNLYQQAQQISKNQRLVTDEQLVAFRANVAKFRAVQEVVQGQTRFAGQMLGSFRISASPMSHLRDMEVASLIEDMGGREVAMRIADDIANVNGIRRLNKVVEETWGSKTLKYLDSWRYNSMLSAPETHGRNIAGNLGALAVRTVEKPVAALSGAARSSLGRATSEAVHSQDSRAYLMETVAEIGALPYGILEGVRLAWKALKDPDYRVGASSTVAEVQFRPALLNTRWAGKNILTKSIAFLHDIALMNGATRLLGAGDAFFKGVAYQSDASARAVRQALAEGLDGDEFVARINELAKGPAPDLVTRSMDEVEAATFTNRLEGGTSLLARGIRGIPGGTIVVPFMRVLANITKWSLQRTIPLNIPWAVAAFRRGGLEADQMVAKMATGAVMGYVAFDQVRQGKITGTGAFVAKETKQQWMRAGWRPNSWYNEKTGEYESIQGFAPVSTILLYYASMAEAVLLTDEEAAFDDYFIGSMAVFASVTVDQTFARGMFEWIGAISDPERYGKRPVLSLASTVVPNWARTVRRAMDEEIRDKETGNFFSDLIATWMDKTPGLSDKLPPAVDYFGRFPEPGYAVFDMSPGRTMKDMKLYKHLIENDVSLDKQKPKQKWGGIEIDLYELNDPRGAGYAFYQWKKYLGESRRAAVNEVIADAGFFEAPAGRAGTGIGGQATRGDYLKKALTVAKKQALEKMLERYPQIEMAIEAELDAISPEKQPLPLQLRPKANAKPDTNVFDPVRF